MALEGLELICCCFEWCLAAETVFDQREKSSRKEEVRAALRTAREEKRGVRLRFAKARITDVEFLEGPEAGKRASELSDMELKRLALSMRHKTARFAIRRYLRHRKKGRVTAPENAAVRR